MHPPQPRHRPLAGNFCHWLTHCATTGPTPAARVRGASRLPGMHMSNRGGPRLAAARGTRNKPRPRSQIHAGNSGRRARSAPTLPFGTILASVESPQLTVQLPVTDARQHGKQREQAILGEKFPGILALCLPDDQCGGRLGNVSYGHPPLIPRHSGDTTFLARACLGAGHRKTRIKPCPGAQTR